MHEHPEVTNENEKKILTVIIFTVVTMVAEIIYGYITNSMALLADGFHMGTHVIALGLTYVAYILMRKFKDTSMFVDGTDKIGVLTAYTSAIFLGFTGLWIIMEALLRFFNPIQILFDEAILVAIIGFIVNVICILIMEASHHEHHQEEKEDYNFQSAYYHILADILTSVLAIFALYIGKYLNFIRLDSLIGIMGGLLILNWTVNLLKNTVPILIDMKKNKNP